MKEHSFDETFYSQITEVRGWLLHNKIEVDEQSYVRLADALHAVSKFKPMESELTRLRSELQQKDELIKELIPIAQWKLRSTTDHLYDLKITKEDNPDKFAEVKRLQSLIEKAKLNYGNREANR